MLGARLRHGRAGALRPGARACAAAVGMLGETAMKEVVYRLGSPQDPALRALAEQATKILEEILGENACEVSAEWELAENGGGSPRVLILILSDWTGSAKGTFGSEELQSPK